MQVEGHRGVATHRRPSRCGNTPAATGALVSNAYATCPPQGDNTGKPVLIPHVTDGRMPVGGKLRRRGMGMRGIRQLAG